MQNEQNEQQNEQAQQQPQGQEMIYHLDNDEYEGEQRDGTTIYVNGNEFAETVSYVVAETLKERGLSRDDKTAFYAVYDEVKAEYLNPNMWSVGDAGVESQAQRTVEALEYQRDQARMYGVLVGQTSDGKYEVYVPYESLVEEQENCTEDEWPTADDWAADFNNRHEAKLLPLQ